MAGKQKAKRIKLALIGAGRMANRVHYPSLAEFQDVEMAALCDLDEKSLNTTADRFKIPKRYTEYRRMLDEVKPDAVYILMPPHQMYGIQIECLERGLHVFVEKPVAATAYQAANLARIAKKNKCLTMCGFQRRFCPALVKTRALVEEHGKIIQCLVRYMKNNTQNPGAYYQHALSILHCDAVHAIDTLMWMGGEIESFSANVSSFDDEIPNAFNALVTFESGAVGFLCTNWAVGKRFFNVEMHACGVSAFADPEADAVIYENNHEEGTRFSTMEAAQSTEFFKYAGFYSENRHFIDCLKKGKQPDTNFEYSQKVMEFVEDIINFSE